ncbi:rhodanese-like domain-containing protein [Desulfovibrio oxyclinae]|uniref:rhodanese-like domain-containing protein n=1 Tax=Desulfovibrio oxyclinae TaxID=63560 RepID=UPI0003666DDD|nr:rhodanese-like domain-containing protein [Desulfovibrio oxyclinae]
MTAYSNMTPDQLRTYMDARRPDEYFLLDVRQPWEYKELHLPGAHLIPLSEVSDRLEEIPSDRPVVTYCRSGGRSSAAAGLLQGKGYEVINLQGGASAWQGHAAFGPVKLGLAAIPENATVKDVLLAACAMEKRLEDFYESRMGLAANESEKDLYRTLAGFEDRHRRTLFNLYRKMVDDQAERDVFEEQAASAGAGQSEGGVEPQRFLEEYGEIFEGENGVIELAMLFEAQALDFYSRCAARAAESEAAEALTHLEREEAAHLKLLGRYMDDLGSSR